MSNREDQLTSIAFSAADQMALIWSNTPIFQKRMRRLGILPETMTVAQGMTACEYRIPKRCIKIKKPISPGDTGYQEKCMRAAHARTARNRKRRL